MAPADDLTYSFTTPDDRDEVLHFYVHQFVAREPLTIGLGLTWEDNHEWEIPIFEEALSCAASVIARDPAKNNKLVGIRLCKLEGKDGGKNLIEARERATGKVRVLLDLLCKMHEGFDPSEDEAVDKVLEYVALGVAKDYSGRGIAYRMCEMSEKRGKELGAQYVRAQATNIRSQRIFQKMGFEVRGSIDCTTYEVDGEKVFDMSRIGNTTCFLDMVKKL